MQVQASQSVSLLGRGRPLLRPRVVTYTVALLLCAPVTTFALELGEASMRNGLGQSLLVEIPYRLAANEQLTSACVSLIPSPRAADALPTYINVTRISISPTVIEVFDENSVREPLIGLNVDVHCNTAPHFVRSYQLFVDPPAHIPAIDPSGPEVAKASNQASIDAAERAAAPSFAVVAGAAKNRATVPTARAPSATPRANVSPRARGHAGGDLTQGQTYRVVRGDTLSGIASRISDRSTIREAMDAVFAANPEAFIRGNRDLIEEGRTLTIPVMSPPIVPVATAPVSVSAAREPESLTAAPVPTLEPRDATPVQNLAPIAAAPVATAPNATQTPAVEEPATVVAPGATVPPPVEVNPFVESSAARSDVPRAAELEPREQGGSAAARSAGWITALLILGAGAALAALLAFVRRLRKPPPAPVAGYGIQRPRPRRQVELAAGIDVVESRMPDAPSDRVLAPPHGPVAQLDDESPPELDGIPLAIGPNDPVDLDVGAPVVIEEGIDWFKDRPPAAASNDAAASDETIEEAATVRMPEIDATVTASPRRLPESDDRSTRTTDEEQMTLTMVELDMLRQDYEAEHTLTQAFSQELRNAVADLEATKALRAAGAVSRVASAEQPQPETTEDSTTSTTLRIGTK